MKELIKCCRHDIALLFWGTPSIVTFLNSPGKNWKVVEGVEGVEGVERVEGVEGMEVVEGMEKAEGWRWWRGWKGWRGWRGQRGWREWREWRGGWGGGSGEVEGIEIEGGEGERVTHNHSFSSSYISCCWFRLQQFISGNFDATGKCKFGYAILMLLW